MASSPAEIARGGAIYCTQKCAWAGKRGIPYKTLDQKFWSKVQIGEPDECWLWLGAIHKQSGYGILALGSSGKQRGYRAHRISWELAHGRSAPKSLQVRHWKCHNPPCVNPRHLRLGTRAQNMQDMVKAGRHRSHWPRRPGTSHWNAKLTDEQVLTIRSRYSTGGITQAVLAREYDISLTNIAAIISRRLWQHLP
jgi:hypothetical protein